MKTASTRSLKPRWGKYVLGLSLAAAAIPGVAVAQAPTGLPNSYSKRNLVSDGSEQADRTDNNLVNPWGLTFNPMSFLWVADNGTGKATVYDGNGNAQPIVVNIPLPSGAQAPAGPTGIIFNGTTGFAVKSGANSVPARIIFVTEQGLVAGWNPDAAANDAITAVDNSSSNAVYKGATLANNGSATFLYATDFHNAKVDVFDSNFAATKMPGDFKDPNLPDGFAPFGIQTIQGDIYVTYAKQDDKKHDDVKGAGLGFISVFDANGRFIRRLITRGNLNAPWGMALAPASFGRFSGRLLVGNFGDGTINAYDLATGRLDGQLQDPHGTVIVLKGLWGLSFGNGLKDQPTNALYFTSGPDDEKHGLFGRIETTPAP
ncbi:TIGR03118 family protein [Myxococcus stipitatus]|uniref:TIGR03118 family protein n=1 Tax=Myxococcus stipitatus TaxID=83455 RepID=UPI0030D3884B